ncbi:MULTISPECIES: hypothetical protein [unclassified Caballeronia]|uniref:hypothetical protein n=1 Tax=unclassified Caballeronia TaxID=2646786 RepID=UPI0020299754|nr:MULTISPECIES: hypothetical protein [unclassified Caballeronia]
MAFSIDAPSIAFIQTRRGVNAVAFIVSDDQKRVGKIHDVVERNETVTTRGTAGCGKAALR